MIGSTRGNLSSGDLKRRVLSVGLNSDGTAVLGGAGSGHGSA